MQKYLNWVLALTVSLFVGSCGAYADNLQTFDGFWEGAITYKGDDLPVRIEIRTDQDTAIAYLDLPSLVYSHQLIPIKIEEDKTITFEFPFGIGEQTGMVNKAGSIKGTASDVSFLFTPTAPPPYRTKDISFGAIDPALEGTLYIPDGEGPYPVVVLLAGSGNANREQWSYASWADFYARQGIAAFVYDRRAEMTLLETGTVMGMDDHAKDVADAISEIKTLPEVDPTRIGVASHSRGGWIAMALGKQVADLAFMVFLSPAPVTPAEQDMDANLTGMDQDGLSSDDLQAARNYYRLYYYVAQTGQGWDLLEEQVLIAQETTWGQYVDQPRTIEDLVWWHANMNFDAERNLRGLKMPVLAFWGGADFITPYANYEGLFRQNLEIGGNANITTYIFPKADHRIEVDPGVDGDGNWHWFGMAPGMQEVLVAWLKTNIGDSSH